MAGRLYVGTSGWAYPAWKGGFYPARIRAADMLAHYASRFAAVEVNHTFRTAPEREVFQGWRDGAPAGFRFALKAPQRITHIRRLRAAGPDVRKFLRATETLADRAGPVLFQCPPNFKADPARLGRFLRLLPPGGRFAFEFRHASWRALRLRVEAAGAAWCVADSDDSPASPDDVVPSTPAGDPVAAAPFVYVRLRRAAYADRDLAAWATRFRACLDAGADIFCFLMHEDTGTGPRWAARIAELAAETTRRG